MSKIYTKNTWVDEVLADTEAYEVIKTGGGAIANVSELADVEINLTTSVAIAGSPVNASRMNNIENGIDAIDTAMEFGWYPVSDTWTYASASTITLPTDATLTYQKGDFIRWKQGGAFKYGVFKTVAATLGTIITNTDYTVANAAITDVAYSRAINPFGWPCYFNYTPTGISATNATQSARFCIANKKCLVDYIANFTGAITFTTQPTLPVAVSASYKSNSFGATGMTSYHNADGAYVLSGMFVILIPSGTVINLSLSDASPMSATAPITWANGDAIEAHFEYEW